MTQKTFFIIPGFKEQATGKNYAWLFEFLKNKNYKVVPVPVAWNYKTLSENAEQLIKFFKKYNSDENYILGFSYGAVLAMLIANEIKPKKLYLCSLSSAFSEDVEVVPVGLIKYIGKRRYLDMNNRSDMKIAKELNVSTTIFYGEREGWEYPQLKKRCEETAKLARNAKLIVVKDAPHKIDFPSYREAIEREIMNDF